MFYADIFAIFIRSESIFSFSFFAKYALTYKDFDLGATPFLIFGPTPRPLAPSHKGQ